MTLETNHTNFYLEDEVKQNLCHEECLDAASNLEKQILDLAKSNIGYKAQIIKRRKEIETETKNFNLHDSFKVQRIVVANRCLSRVQIVNWQNTCLVMFQVGTFERSNV